MLVIFLLNFNELTSDKFRQAKTEPKVADVMSTLFVPYKKGVLPFDKTAEHLLAGESHLLVNAGR